MRVEFSHHAFKWTDSNPSFWFGNGNDLSFVLRSSRDLAEPKPCKRKCGSVPFERMLRHIKEDKCEQCRALVLYLERESEIEVYLRRSRN